MFKVATWNVNSLNVRLGHVLQWLHEHQPTVLGLQETKIIDADFPIEAFNQAGYNIVFAGQKAYNGVAIIAKQLPDDIHTELPTLLDPQRRLLAVSCGSIRIINVYVPNGESSTSEKYIYKFTWLNAFKDYLQAQLALYKHVLVIGDFNIAPAEQDVHEPALWQDSVLFSQSVRDMFQQLLLLGLKDTFRLFDQAEKSFSWWDYRAAAFRRNLGLRIDHILASDALAKLCTGCQIDKMPRKWERPSDHTPVIASFQLDE